MRRHGHVVGQDSSQPPPSNFQSMQVLAERIRYKVVLLRLFQSAIDRIHQAFRKVGVVLLSSIGFAIGTSGFHIRSRSKLFEPRLCKNQESFVEYVFQLRMVLKEEKTKVRTIHTERVIRI